MRRVSFLSVLFLLLLSALPAVADSPFTQRGFASGHGVAWLEPNESVDPLSGNLLITATDLVLPGNAGLDLAVTRIYSSQIHPDFETNGSTAYEDDTWAGLGWRLHWGRVLHTELTGAGQTVVELPGGGGGALYHTSVYSEGWMTKGFARYNRSTRTLKLPNGRVYTFGQAVTTPRGGTERYVTRIEDPYGNWITFEYFTSPGPTGGVSRIRQYLSASQIREVTFTYDATLKSLATMVYSGRTWTYTQAARGTGGHSVLTGVQPPAGFAWSFGYGAAPYSELTSMTNPVGGRLTYTYGTVTRYASTTTKQVRVITTRVTSGPDVTSGTWTYAYSQGTNKDQSVVTSPCGKDRYTFLATGLSGTFTAWLSGVLGEHTVEDLSNTVLEREAFSYLKSEAISTDSIPGENGLWSDPAVYTALVDVRTVTRGTQSWTTDHDYHWGQGTFNDYGQPYLIGTDGERYRLVTRVFRTGFTPHILGRIASEEIKVGGEAIWNTYGYELSTGFTTASRPYGVETTYTRTSTGNVATATDARGHATSYQYDWGVASRIQTPLLLTTRTINEDGTVASETTGSLTTQYTYDALKRPLWTKPPGYPTLVAGSHYYYEGESSGRLIGLVSGPYESRTFLDGLGRTVKSVGIDGVIVKVLRDACGRVTGVSAPYTTSTPRYTTTAYDALGRPLTVTAPDGSVTTSSYTGNDVTVTDAEGRRTIFSYTGSGSPDNAVLESVTDPANQRTTYAYNNVDTLIRVSVPGVPTRSWAYDGANRLLTETQPESGTTAYQHDAVGNLTRVTNAAGEVTNFTYDANNRMTGRDAPGTVGDLTINYDTNGRVSTQQTPTATTTLTYDGASRVATRSDQVGTLAWQSSYGYNASSQLTQVTYPSGRVVGYSYDPVKGRLLAVTQNSATFADLFAYTDGGLRTSLRTGAVTQQILYDTRDRVQSLATGSLLNLTYAYDRTSNVRDITDTRPGYSQAFAYDALQRLTTADGPWGNLTYTYDAAGNRLTERRNYATASYSYDTATQRLQSTLVGSQTESFGYNALGQLTSDGLASYTYSPTGRLLTAQNATLQAEYGYDADDLRLTRRIKVGTDWTTVYTVRGADERVLSEYVATCTTPAWTRDLIYAGGLIGAVKATQPQPTLSLTGTTTNVTEGGTTAATVQLTTPNGQPLSCPLTATWTVTLGTASAADLVDQRVTVTFAAGTASGSTRPVSVATIQDALAEANETFTIALDGVIGGTLAGVSSAQVTIVDDDPTPSISIADAAATEGSTAAFILTLSAPSGRPVSVDYQTVSGTALEGTDFWRAAGTAVFEPGTASLPLLVPTTQDAAYEVDETWAVQLSAPLGATLARAQAAGVILDDDSRPASGWLDAASLTWAQGWAYDPDYTGPIWVHVYVDGVFMAAALADQYRADLVPYGNGGFRAFNIPVVVGCGSHTVAAYAIGVYTSGRPDGANPALPGSPKTITRTCPAQSPTGSLDLATTSRVAGWANDPDFPNRSLTVDVYVDGWALRSLVADYYRPDLVPIGNAGNLAFDNAIVMGCGTHRIDVMARGLNASGAADAGYAKLPNSPSTQTRTCTGTPPTAVLESATPTRLVGYAYDPDQANTALSVDLYRNGLFWQRVTANLYRADQPGNGLHGFDIPISLTCNVTYRIDVFAVGVNGSGVADDGFTLGTGAPVWLTDTCSGLMAGVPGAESLTAGGQETGEGSPEGVRLFGPPGYGSVEGPIFEHGQQPTVENAEVPPTTEVQR